ncbi:helix-hairpin-helix domain-containing protein [Spirosoma sp. 209]|uniref:helix-hairpin-helix domain-containing protein n=1 Tax=Spirosoma sp. 209 TaxID=1955701 RepID=UPI00098CFB5B|nr:helix-hairpin-helix domain-containing protein [Spirosoma sp. 209]
MSPKNNLRLPLTEAERTNLRKHKVNISDFLRHALDELAVYLGATPDRTRELYALAQFQTIPSVGPKFASDLIFLGYYSLAELVDKDGATLMDQYEQEKGYWIDPCVEDQFRLAIHYAQTSDATKTWWDFTPERKAYRSANGYPPDRPTLAWHETPAYQRTPDELLTR